MVKTFKVFLVNWQASVNSENHHVSLYDLIRGTELEEVSN